MHSSRLAGFIIDCQTDDLGGAAGFWSAALGMAVRELPGAEGEKYRRLVDPANRLHIEVQTVSHPSRVHLDIETDDIESEVRRLEALGAQTRAAGAGLVGDGSPDRPALLRGQGRRRLAGAARASVEVSRAAPPAQRRGYQICARSPSGRHIGCPGSTPKAA